MSKNYNCLSPDTYVWLKRNIVGALQVRAVKKNTAWMTSLSLVFFILTGQAIFAQANSYNYATSIGNSLVTITSPVVLTTTVEGTFDDAHNMISPAGFTFNYNGVNYTQFGVSTNGWVQFGNAVPTTGRPTAINGFGTNAVVAFERDSNMNVANGGSMTHGAAPGGLYVFQFVKLSGGGSGSASATAYITMQIVLWGSTSSNPGQIDFIYGASAGSPPTAGVIGITDTANTFINGVDGSKVSATATSSSWPASGRMYTFTPPPPCNGTPVVGAATPVTSGICVGATQVLTVTGGTTGVSNLAYQWETSADGLTGWANVSSGTGATTKVYTTAAYVSGTQYYRMKSTCTATADFDYSNVVSVTGPSTPTTQASNVIATNATATSISLAWTNGDGNNRSVFVSDTNSFTDPVNGVSPGTASTTYTGSGQKLVYDNTGTSVTVTGLSVGVTYYFRIYESRKCGSPNYFYNTTSSATNPVAIGTADKLKYTIGRSSGISYTPVSGSATTVTALTGTSDDNNYGPFIFFPFNYAGTTISSFRVSVNGWMTLNATNTNTTTVYQNGLTNSTGQNLILAPFWEDLYANNATPSSQFVKYEITGSAPNRVLTVQWENVELFNYPGPSLNFQAKLYESDSHIEYVYGVMQGFDGTNPNNASVANGLAFSYTVGMNAATWGTPAVAGSAIGLQQANSLSFTSLGGITQNEGINKLSVLPECSSMYTFTPNVAIRANDLAPGVPTAPSNDEPATAITLTALPSIPANFCGSFYSSAFATPSAGIAPAIASTIADDDVWFSFVANSANTTITLRGSGGYDAAMQLFNDGDYTTVLAQKNVNGMTGTSLTETINQVDFVTSPGSTYKIRVYHAGGGNQSTATATVSGGVITGFTVTTPGSGYITCYGGVSNTATPFVYITDATGVGAVAKATVTGGAISSIAIQGAQGGTGYSATPTVTVAPSGFGVTGDFSIIVNATPAPPANDNICSAQALTTAAACTPTAGSTYTASASPQAACAGIADDDVWYSFVSTGANTVTVQSGTGFNAHLEILSSSDNTCTGTLTSVNCTNATVGAGVETFTSSALIPGNTYFVRVYHTASGAGTGSFTICVTAPAPSCVSNTSPANAAVGISQTPTLTWSADPLATNYDVYLGTTSGGETFLGNSLTTSYAIGTPLATSSQYFWYVVPKNLNGSAPCTSANETSFTTANSLDYVSLQWPVSGNASSGSPLTVYGQVYEGGLTDVEPGLTGQAAGIEMWVGTNSTDTDPSTWSTWTVAAWNPAVVGNNDEYRADIGGALAVGTYYYATRFRLGGAGNPYSYGGITSGGVGGFWDGVTYESGVLTVTGPVNDFFAGAIPIACATTVTGTTATATNDEPNPAVFGVADTASPNVWYSYTGSGTPEVISLSLCNSAYDTAVLIATGTSGNLTYIAGNDDSCGTSGFRSQVSFESDGTTTYWIMVRGYGVSSTGVYEMIVSCAPACTPVAGNNDCAGAEAITFGVSYSTNNTCATPSAVSYPTCDGQFASYYDTWYTFNTEDHTALRLSMNYIAPVSLGYAVYSGTCGAITQIYCSTTGAALDMTGLTINTNYYVRVYAKSTAARGAFSLETGVIPCSIPTTWDGATWSNGNPIATQPAVIAGDFISSSDLSACLLTVNNNADVVVSSGNDFIITGAVTVTAGATLTFENNANLLQTTNAANTGNIKVKREATMRRLDYVYWGAPVAGQDLKLFSPQTVSPPVGASRFYTMNEANNSFAVIAEPSGVSFVKAKGYMLRAPNDFPTNGSQATFFGEFNGVPNNGNAAIAITNTPGTGQGFNMLGNPYPSTVSASLFLTQNPGALYFWAHANQNAASGANYATYTTFGTAAAAGGATPDGSIAVGQGFLLKTAASGTATFTNAMRTGNNSALFFRSENVEKSRIWLNLTNEVGTQNQILVGYMEGATMDADVSIDAKQIEGGISNIASLIGDDKYNIQARALPFVNTDEVPLSFNALTAGTFTIAIDHVDGLFAADQDVFIKDNVSGITHNVKQSGYTFAAEAGTTANRFSVVFQDATLGIENPGFDANNVIVFKNNNVLNINSGSVTMSGVKVFDIRGRLIFEQSDINANTAVLTNLRAEQEVLLVQVTSTDNRVVTKKVVY